MILYLSLALASFAFVFLKAFQQRSVAFDNFASVLPTSLAMATMEVYTVSQVAKNGWHIGIVLAVGTASGLGAMAAMLIHRRLFKRG